MKNKSGPTKYWLSSSLELCTKYKSFKSSVGTDESNDISFATDQEIIQLD